jgi:anti-sigma factor RsiW
MTHPTPGALLELHFGEMDARRRDVLAGHVESCPSCRAVVAEWEWVERALAAGPDEDPPRDGLERVLARVEAIHPIRRKRDNWLRAAAPSAAALLFGAWATHAAGPLGALALVALGSILTLSLAPVLILESQRRSR